MDRLLDRHLLLAVDNCEHLAEPVAIMIDNILAGCRNVSAMATSRQPLRLRYEVTYAVEPLSLRGTVEEPDAGSPAVVLFRERAAAGAGIFELDASNLGHVWEICRRLDGIPLAIELAAARCRVLSPAEIADEMRRDRPALAGDRRGAPPRQRSLEASLAWSWQLLDAGEADLLASLAVFPADFSRDAAAAVAGRASELILRSLSSLCDHSLVQVVKRQTGTRYRLSDTVRSYARHRLSAADGWAPACDRLLEWCGHTGAEMAGRGGGRAIEALEAELPAFRAALDHAVEGHMRAPGLRLALDLMPLWSSRHVVDGLDRFRRLLNLASDDDDARLEGLLAAINLALLTGDSTSCLAWGREALAMRASLRLGDHAGYVTCRCYAGELAMMAGNVERASAACAEAVQAARERGAAVPLNRALLFAAAAALRRGDLATATTLLAEGMASSQRAGDDLNRGLTQAWVARLLDRLSTGAGRAPPATNPPVAHHRGSIDITGTATDASPSIRVALMTARSARPPRMVSPIRARR